VGDAFPAMIGEVYMDTESVCRLRRIGKTTVVTPLLVPSFSSVASDEIIIQDVFSKLSDHMFEASLVSAYDLKYELIDKEEIWTSDVVFVDSGNHEVEYLRRMESRKLRDWSASIYSNLIDSLRPLTRVVLVNFDQKKHVRDQVDDAQELFAKHQEHANCFLVKPSSRVVHFVDVGALTKSVALLEPFDILGLTEKELGASLLNRCQNLLRIRAALNSINLPMPIHIFGCMDPLSILSYFLCGADIFDGTETAALRI